MGNLKIYTADDEEPRCTACVHVNDSDKWCAQNCGATNGWFGYKRTEFGERKERKN